MRQGLLPMRCEYGYRRLWHGERFSRPRSPHKTVHEGFSHGVSPLDYDNRKERDGIASGQTTHQQNQSP